MTAPSGSAPLHAMPEKQAIAGAITVTSASRVSWKDCPGRRARARIGHP
jgi:hypothetical protein